ncbi:CoA transferase [Roseobacter sp. HKCCD9010]|uniref:CaiB/BaiF CoA transferase family protein n=1 Tax=unclassified Roseobacter TaxID=196798 RepID=UPI001492F8F9|nr:MULTISPECIES: CaiB/BaiF CoA-transferase family protein [unclassified Roseobacter]MBF9052286.1 CoA transferase [Rhodobacterales bacterium HKCCD4356]NNV14253.1 CoA transferase [Roseobacter sp. HKCCD7357]NNV18446.1 CoA transferase [Roseobacter sp. HKCCD8768]NNV27886.1 CoA transferase [Roseobacter sp. HKCCD8192]NNV32178.1 CoA transferase [Roseobacter sp. HKCCD9061]
MTDDPRPDRPADGGPLTGLRVLDIATIIAGPMAASLLADFGAEVIKLEIPDTGDGLRSFPPFKEGKSLWWKVTNRGKQFGTLDLRTPEGATLFLDLVAKADVVVENFRPGTLERWGLGVDTLWARNPRLVILRVSGFGQDGPCATQPGFARIFEAMGGLTYITGEPDAPPMHTGYPLADSIGGVFGAFAVAAALLGRDRSSTARGEEIDLSLTEAMLRTLESLAIEYDQLGTVRERSGNRNTYSAPSDVYMTADKRYVSLAGSTNRTFANNARAIGQPNLIDDPRFADNAARVAHTTELDRIFGAWIAAHTLDEVLTAFRTANGTLAPIYGMDQVFADPQMQAREAITPVTDDDFGSVRMQNVVPRMRNAPGAIRWAAKALGADNAYVYKTLLKLDDDEIERLRERGCV